MLASRLSLRRTVPLAAAVLLGGVAIAGGARSLYTRHLEAELDAEIEAVRASGLLERERATEAPELVDARNRLDGILLRIAAVHMDQTSSCAFGSPCMQRPELAARLAAGLAERAGLLAEFDALPQLLWDAAREPSRSGRSQRGTDGEREPSNSMLALRAATNLLCGQAWFAARDPRGGAEAGHRLALALALARVTDSGGGFELGLRSALEGIVVDTLERLHAEAVVDRQALDGPLLWELARDDCGDRLRLAVETDLIALVEALAERRLWWVYPEEHPSRLEVASQSLASVRFYRARLADDLTQRHRPPFVSGALLTSPWYESSVDFSALARDSLDNLRARILCAG